MYLFILTGSVSPVVCRCSVFALLTGSPFSSVHSLHLSSLSSMERMYGREWTSSISSLQSQSVNVLCRVAAKLAVHSAINVIIWPFSIISFVSIVCVGYYIKSCIVYYSFQPPPTPKNVASSNNFRVPYTPWTPRYNRL